MTWLHDGNGGGCDQDFNPEGWFCPYGIPGDRLWVRETWQRLGCGHDQPFTVYKASNPEQGCHWRPSLFMPKEFSRITLEIISVRIERLQEITGIDAVREGCGKDIPSFELLHFGGYKKAKEEFIVLWDSINGKKYPWESNPWVWCIEFTRIKS